MAKYLQLISRFTIAMVQARMLLYAGFAQPNLNNIRAFAVAGLVILGLTVAYAENAPLSDRLT